MIGPLSGVSAMRKVAIIVGILAGAALAFVLCGGVDMVRSVSAALNNPPAPVSVESLAE